MIAGRTPSSHVKIALVGNLASRLGLGLMAGKFVVSPSSANGSSMGELSLEPDDSDYSPDVVEVPGIDDEGGGC